MSAGVREVGQTSHPQRDKRTYVEAVDPHGRTWGFVVDISAKPKPGPVSLINPVGWDAPRHPVTGFCPGVPPQKYLQFNPSNMFKLGINYDAWIADQRAARLDWENELHVKAAQMSPSDAGASLIGNSQKDYEDASPALLKAVGIRYNPVQPIIAAKQGNSWVLGKTSKIDPRLKDYFPDPVADEPDYRDEDFGDVEEEADPEAVGSQSGRAKVPESRGKLTWTEFAAQQMADGKTMREAGAAWKLLKEQNAV